VRLDRFRLSFVLTFCLVFFSIASGASATPPAATPEFRMLNRSGAPIARAHISVVGRTGSTLADAEGRFRLEPVPPVPFEIAVSDERGTWLGLVRITRLEIGIAGGQDVSLPEGAGTEITVRAGLAPTTLAPPAAAATSFSRAELDERRPARLVDVLEDLPGSVRPDEGKSAVPAIRGLSSSRTLLLLDDGRVNSERRAGPSASFLDPFSLENIEVVRGPGTVAYGSDAIGGVMHARTPLPNLQKLGGRFEVSGGIGAESSAGISLEANVPLGPAALLIQGHQRHSADYDSPSGPVDDSSWRDRGILVRGLLPAGGARLFFGLQIDEAIDVGKPGTDSNVTRTFYPEELSRRFTLGADIGPTLGFSDVEIRGFFGTHHLITNRERLPSGATTRRLSQGDVRAKDAGLRVIASRPAASGVIRVGLDANSRFGLEAENNTTNYNAADQVTTLTNEVAVDSARRMDIGLFAETDQSLVKDALDLSLGLRGDLVSTKNTGGFAGDRSTNKGAFSGYGSVTVTPAAGVSATLQYARGFRDPLLSDRYFRGVSGRGFVVGNPDLRAETSNQFDLAIRSDWGPAHVAAYGFVYRIGDLIERYQDGSDFFFRNRGEAEIRGAELEADVDLAARLSVRVTLGITSGSILDDGSRPAGIPPRSASLTLHHRLTERLWTRLRVGATARQSAPGPLEIERPGFAVVDLSAGLRLAAGLEIRAVLKNVLDQSFLASSETVAVDAMGRSASLVLGGRF
jgi:outer membrane receptor protein involved in Fe transport